MARPLRIELAGGLGQLTLQGDRREAIYRNDQDREDRRTVESVDHCLLHCSVVSRPVGSLEGAAQTNGCACTTRPLTRC
jgi:hypothetical protein